MGESLRQQRRESEVRSSFEQSLEGASLSEGNESRKRRLDEFTIVRQSTIGKALSRHVGRAGGVARSGLICPERWFPSERQFFIVDGAGRAQQEMLMKPTLVPCELVCEVSGAGKHEQQRLIMCDAFAKTVLPVGTWKVGVGDPVPACPRVCRATFGDLLEG